MVRTVINLSAISWMFLVKTNYLDFFFFPNQFSNRNKPFDTTSVNHQVQASTTQPSEEFTHNVRAWMPPTGRSGPKQGPRENQTLLRSQRNEPYTAWFAQKLSGCWSVRVSYISQILNGILVEEQLQSAVIWHWQFCLVPMFLVELMSHSGVEDLDIIIQVAITEMLRCDYHGPHHL